jgi:hypothetical protein
LTHQHRGCHKVERMYGNHVRLIETAVKKVASGN